MSIQWCTSDDIDAVYNLGVSETPVRAPFTADVVAAQISIAGRNIEGHLRSRYEIPSSIADIPDDLQWICAVIAGYGLLLWRGSETEDAIDRAFGENYKNAKETLKSLQEDQIHPGLTMIDGAIPKLQPYNMGTSVDSGGWSQVMYPNRGQ
jgi:phage gp36-like protein